MAIKKYRLKKRIKNFLVFYICLCILFVASYTLSRYVQVEQGTSGIDFAKFDVSINDISVSDGIPIQFNFSESSTFMHQKVAPNNSGYFEFVINPHQTEVSLEYELTFHIDDIDKDFQLTYYEINDDGNHHAITDGNYIKNDLLLPNNERGFTEADKVSVKVYWSWDAQEDFINPDINNYENKNINVIATVKQKIN